MATFFRNCYCAALFILLLPNPAFSADLQAVIAGAHRSPDNKARDIYRHPQETLNFMGVDEGMTVVEIWPGEGWYTEILAPYLAERGVLYAAHFAQNASDYFATSRAKFLKKLDQDPENYAAVHRAEFDPGQSILTVPDAVADRVLTFRNVHNWLRNDSEAEAFRLFYKALKPGGLLGVVEHSGPPGKPREWMLENGYMDEDVVVKLALGAGFEFLSSSSVNANHADRGEHPAGVWTLPPTLRLGDKNRDHYLGIGESNRMTLLFRKPSE